MTVEQALLRRAKSGDRQAFARLVQMHREAVYRAAFHVLKDPEEALDATQEALLRAYRYLDRFEGRSSFQTWARRIATNVAIDRYQRRRRTRAREQAFPEDLEPADAGAVDVDANLLRNERRALVQEAIETLPPAQKAAVLLRDVHGLSYAEIGEQLSIPKGTVMSRIYYGRAALKEKLADSLGPRADDLKTARREES
ncbi:MAG: sigma-70 family RNA polymerase sigma factor [Planctomycetes bacterium]|nr:sigma-70 family RNA polymerase sigma factor [Planctomycetota bacterium]